MRESDPPFSQRIAAAPAVTENRLHRGDPVNPVHEIVQVDHPDQPDKKHWITPGRQADLPVEQGQLRQTGQQEKGDPPSQQVDQQPGQGRQGIVIVQPTDRGHQDTGQQHQRQQGGRDALAPGEKTNAHNKNEHHRQPPAPGCRNSVGTARVRDVEQAHSQCVPAQKPGQDEGCPKRPCQNPKHIHLSIHPAATLPPG